MDIVAYFMPFIIILNGIMTYSLFRKANRFAKVLAKYENREHIKLERDTMEALFLLRSGKTDEAKIIAERIMTS